MENNDTMAWHMAETKGKQRRACPAPSSQTSMLMSTIMSKDSV